MRSLRVASATILLCLLQACGGGGGGGGDGGGGGGDGGGGAGFTISLDRTSIAYDFFEGTQPPTQTVTAIARGEYTGNLYVAATLEGGQGIDPAIPIAISGTTGTISVRAASNLAEGTYNGRIQFHACSDQQCARHIGGTPIAVTYTVKVKRGVRFTPASVSMAAQSGEETSALATVQLPEGTSTYSLEGVRPEWLTATSQDASSFTLRARSMPVGIYNAFVRVASGGAYANLPVSYTVSAPPGGERGFLASPESLALGASEGGQVTRTLLVTPPTWKPGLLESIQYSGPTRGWLTVTTTTGGYNVTASAASLSQGTYTATIVISTVPSREALSIPVVLTVGPGFIKPATTTLNITAETTPAQLSGRTRIDVVSGAPVEWTASTTTPWLSLTRANGLAGSDVEFTIDPTVVDGWSNFTDHEATIRIVGASLSPVDCDIEVRLRLAEVTGVGPHLLIAGQSSKIVVRGRGFTGLPTPLGRLRINNAPATSAVVVNDSKMTVEAGALALGSHVVRVTNALNRSLETRDLRVIAAETYAYKAIPINLSTLQGPLLYDAERQNAYALGIGAGLMRFPVTSSSTVAQIVATAGGLRIGMTADGANFITGDQYGFSLLDRDTLAVVPGSEYSSFGHIPTVYGLYPAADAQGLMVSNDSRLWYSGFRSLDIDTKAIRSITLSPSAPASFNTVPAAISRNGEKLVGIDTSVEPAYMTYPLVYVDASDSVLHRVADPVDTFPQMMLSDDGERVLAGYNTVLDGELNIVGDIALPASASDYDPLTAAISPDGARVYVMTYRRDDYDNPTPAFSPRVYVFDSSTPVAAPQTLPVEGYFEFDDYPSCMRSACYNQTFANITPDGGALLFGGNRNIVVVPTDTPVTAARAPGGIRKAGVKGFPVVRWDLRSGE